MKRLRQTHVRMRGNRLRTLAAILAMAGLLAWTPRVAMADTAISQMMSYSVMTGLFLEVGKAEYSGGKNNPGMPVATGLRYYERQGVITGTLTAIMIMLGGAAAASSPKSQRSWESGGYRYTETTYRSDAEKAAIMAGAAAGAGAAASAKNQSFDLEIFSRSLGGDVSGWRMNGYFGIPFAEHFMFELGMGGGSIDTAMMKNTQEIYVSHGYVGMPFRFNYATDTFLIFLDAQWNWIGHAASSKADPYLVPGTNAMLLRYAPVLPLKLGISSNLFGRLYGELSLMTPGITTAEFAFRTVLGLRF